MKILISGYGKMGRMIEQIILSKGLEYAGWSEDITATPAVILVYLVKIGYPDQRASEFRDILFSFILLKYLIA